jgi:hypothetical protein
MATDAGAPRASPGALLGVFREPDDVARALDGLRAAGFAGHDLVVLSGAPYPEGAFGEEPERHRLYVYPLVGAACGFAVGLLLTIGTQLAYPLVTGGKPILAIPPMINVIYGGTLLGAILLTVLGVLLESRLPDFSEAPHDPRISQGYLGVLVTRAGDDGRRGAAERALRRAGAVDVVARSPEPGEEHIAVDS